MRMQGANEKPLSMTMTPLCTFSGGDENGGYTGEQLKYPCKLRRHICSMCGKHRGEHRYAGVRDEHLPPPKRAVFRRLVQFQVQMEKRAELEEGETWTGDAMTKGERIPRTMRANLLGAEKVEVE